MKSYQEPFDIIERLVTFSFAATCNDSVLVTPLQVDVGRIITSDFYCVRDSFLK